MMDPIAQREQHTTELQQLGGRRIGVFGSVVKNEASSESDVDVYVEFDPAKRNFRNFNALYELFESIFGWTADWVPDAALSVRSARIILPTVRYASLGS